MPSLSDLGEFGLIDRLAASLGPAAAPGLVASIGDDAAVVRIGDGPDGAPRVHVVTTDALVEGVHFERRFTTLDDLGAKAVAVNVSDVCAMNARPRWLTVALGLPDGLAVDDVEALYRGIARACARYGCAVVGGDTTRAPGLLLSVTALGEAAEAEVAYRSGARVGDVLCVTGDVGAAHAGLRLLFDARDRGALGRSFDAAEHVLARQLAPVARLDVVEALARAGVRPTAMIDVSDGVASEVHHLARRSGVGAWLDAAALPVHPETRAVAERFGADPHAWALFGGEDYELLLTLRPEDAARLSGTGMCTPLGRVVDASEGVVVRTAGGDEAPLAPGGFVHFGHTGDAPPRA